MKVCIAPDSFKESVSAPEAAESIARGVRKAFPDSLIIEVPMSDGGEGTVAAMVNATGGRIEVAEVTGPLGNRIPAEFGILGGNRKHLTAVIEMAAASGLALVPAAERNPLNTTTYGTGELIKVALDRGARTIIIGIGGSATVDGGIGMAQALGVRFSDAAGKEIAGTGGGLRDLAKIDLSDIDPRIQQTRIEVACDVENPLTGPEGAATVYGPQKGATPEAVKVLDRNLRRLAEVVKRDLGKNVEQMPGAGAAGGLGAGLFAFLGADIRPGFETVAESVRLKDKMQKCLASDGLHLVITGEGRLDEQTPNGKVPIGVARAAKSLGMPVIAIGGSVREYELLNRSGIDAVFSLIDSICTFEEIVEITPVQLAAAAEQAVRLFALGWLSGRKNLL